jgi:membrane carboxypeptidase/penicillin-binding protein
MEMPACFQFCILQTGGSVIQTLAQSLFYVTLKTYMRKWAEITLAARTSDKVATEYALSWILFFSSM